MVVRQPRMAAWPWPRLWWLAALVAGLVSGDSDTSEGGDHGVAGHSKMVICYWGTWANYRPIEGKFTPESVDGSLCTHLIYSFAGLHNHTLTIVSLDTEEDIVKGEDAGCASKIFVCCV